MKTRFFVEFFFFVIIGNELATIVTAITITGNDGEIYLSQFSKKNTPRFFMGVTYLIDII